MVDIPFPLSTSPGFRSQDGSGRLVNAFAEPRGENQGPVWRRVPGFIQFSPNVGTGALRGGLQVNNLAYVALDTTAYSIASDGTATALGTLPSASSRVFWARNNSATPTVVAVTNGNAYYINSGAVADYPDNDVGSPTCVCGHLSYFIFGYGDGSLIASGLNSTAINTLDTANAESNPDGVLRNWSYNGYLWVAGEHSIEVWGGVNTTAFPFSPLDYKLNPGLMTADAVAGFEVEFGGPVAYVGRDNTVRQINGFAPEKISPPALDRLIEALVDKDELSASVYIAGGHRFWQLSCDSWTWTFNFNNGTWHERESYGSTRSRINKSFPAFDKWLCGDTTAGDLYEISSTANDEAGRGVSSGISNTFATSGVSGGTWAGWTTRVRIEASQLAGLSGDTCTITFAGGITEGLFIAEAFIDRAGNNYDFFSSTPIPITFNGGNDVTIPALSFVTSDPIDLPIDGTFPVVISLYVSDPSYDQTSRTEVGGAPGWSTAYLNADDAETQIASGYTVESDIAYFVKAFTVQSNEVILGDPLIATIESGPVDGFPNRARVRKADFKFATGVGISAGSDPTQTTPSVLIYWSDDGGVSWSNPYTRKLGAQAHGDQRVIALNTGIAGPLGRRWRLKVSDAVDVSFMGGAMDAGVQNR